MRVMRFFALCLAWAWMTVVSTVPALSEAPNDTFSTRVNDGVRAAKNVAREVGVHVVAVDSAQTAYSYRADTRHIIASNTKLLTSAAALDRLGPGFFFETQILAEGRMVDGRLDGDLAVVGSGDPTFSGRRWLDDPLNVFRDWARKLRAKGLRVVSGDLVLDHGVFDDELVHPDWPTNQLDRWYEAPVDALSFSDNCILVRVRPTRTGRAATVELVPEVPGFRVEGQVETVARGRGQRFVRIGRSAPGVLTVGGQIPIGDPPSEKWVAVYEPVEYFGRALVDVLASEGLVIEGELKPVRSLPHAAWRRVLIERTDLVTVLEVVNRRSQNFYAEAVLKGLAAALCRRGTWAEGLGIVSDFLDGIGMSNGWRMSDGSGMSRNNLFTPRQLTHLLEVMYRHPHGRVFMRTLAASGVEDQSLEKRLNEPPYLGNVLAKTGTLSGVSTLSGYAKARSGRLYAFSILTNKSRSAWRSRRAQDQIVRAIIDHG
ncbi:MAG: D-alanyl-D-alanine carboxypeptidase/D-alanyl-D-alanine-endopeptidase [Acidobacteriota bacterium]